MDALHVGLGVHHVLLLPADEDNELEAIVCEAALITKIRSKEEGIVSLCVFPEASEIFHATGIVHSLALEDGTWHFISECQTGS